MNRDKLDTFFLTLDAHLQAGREPEEALRRTVRSYATVFYPTAPATCRRCGAAVENGRCPACFETQGVHGR